MKTFMYRLQLMSQRAPEFIDITHQVHDCVAQANINNGFVVVFSKHTTAAVTINENEPLLLHDMEQFLERIAPRHGGYQHNDFSIRTHNMTAEESPNGHAHCQNLLFHTSEIIPIIQSCLQFGRWQSLFFVELDHPRPREVVVQVVGE